MEIYLLKGFISRTRGIRSDRKFEAYCRKDAFKVVLHGTQGKSALELAGTPKITEASNFAGENKEEFLESFDLKMDHPVRMTAITENKYKVAFVCGFGTLDAKKMVLEDSHYMFRKSTDTNRILRADVTRPQCVAAIEYDRLMILFRLDGGHSFYIDGEEIKNVISKPKVFTRTVLENQRARQRFWERPVQNPNDEIAANSATAINPINIRKLKDRVYFVTSDKTLVTFDLRDTLQMILSKLSNSEPWEYSPNYSTIARNVQTYDVTEKGIVTYYSKDFLYRGDKKSSKVTCCQLEIELISKRAEVFRRKNHRYCYTKCAQSAFRGFRLRTVRD